MKHDEAETNSRREFLKTSAVAGTGAAVAALLPGAAAAAVDAESVPAPDKKKGYQQTQHVLDYYKTAKL